MLRLFPMIRRKAIGSRLGSAGLRDHGARLALFVDSDPGLPALPQTIATERDRIADPAREACLLGGRAVGVGHAAATRQYLNALG
jgi:hypothetical protein